MSKELEGRLAVGLLAVGLVLALGFVVVGCFYPPQPLPLRGLTVTLRWGQYGLNAFGCLAGWVALRLLWVNWDYFKGELSGFLVALVALLGLSGFLPFALSRLARAPGGLAK